MSRKIKVCFLSESAYQVLTEKERYVGGAEVQMSILAKELAKKTYDVSFVAFDKCGSMYEVFKGVKIYNPFDNRFGGYSYMFPQNIYKLIKVINKIDADIYIKKGYSPLTGVIAFIAKLKNKAFLFVASHEWDVSKNLDISGINNLGNIFYRFGVKHCHSIICQTNRQKRLLKQKIGRDGFVIKNLYPIQKIGEVKKKPQKLKILWVGRLAQWKRAELFLKLAKKLPDFRFWMIASRAMTEQRYYNEIKKAADKLDNLNFIGYVPHKKINRYYRESSMLVSTSICEGFPNTFLEAWGNSTPVVSLGFDPDEIICNNRIGLHVENFNDLVKSIYMLLKNKSLREKMGIEGRKYVEKEHSVNSIMNKYEKIFNEIKSIEDVTHIR